MTPPNSKYHFFFHLSENQDFMNYRDLVRSWNGYHLNNVYIKTEWMTVTEWGFESDNFDDMFKVKRKEEYQYVENGDVSRFEQKICGLNPPWRFCK